AQIINKFTLRFQSALTSKNNKVFSCPKEKRVVVGSKTMDIFCDINIAIGGITLAGEGIQTLCSVYVSG
ncbi:multiple epidermal growth factor-like domains protein 11, partial [Biomphalaria glabrata]